MARETRSATDKRRSRRYKVFERGYFIVATAEQPLHLLDISVTGIRAHALETPQVGRRLEIGCGEALGLARIAWVNGQLFGAHFVVPLAMATVARIVDRKPLPPLRVYHRVQA